MMTRRPDVQPRASAEMGPDGNRWSERPLLARVLKLLVLLAPIFVSVGFVAVASRIVRRPERWYGVAGWWIGLTLASTVVLAAAERVMRRFLPLIALFRLSLVFPDRSPSRFKIAMRTNTLRQLQRSLEAGDLDQADFQEAAERLVAMAGALNAHDRMTRGHTERVRAYTLMIGEELKLPKPDLDRLHWAGLVHDIGKLEVPPSILNKPGRPDEKEWEILKQHPAAAVRLIEPLRPWLGEWADAASQHHERWDGKGYPYGLSGEQISLSGRIVAVADAFDVMTSVRSYKKAMTPEAARAELLRCAGTQFDANVVRAFLNISVGKLRLVMGPLSWLAQAPALGNVPIGTAAATAASSLLSVGIAVASGFTGNDPAPNHAPPPVVAFADSPVAQEMTIRVLEDQRITLDPMSAAGGDPPTSLSVTVVPDHLSIDPAAPSSLVPDDNWFGRTAGEYQACWHDQCSTARLDVDVQSVNDRPIASPDGATTPEATAVTIDVLANDTDIEDQRPVLTAVNPVTPPGDGTAIMTSDGTVRFQPADGFVGTTRVNYEIADNEKASATGTVTVQVTRVDSPPRAADDNVTSNAGTTETIDVLANDADDENEPLTIVSVTPPRIGEVILTANSLTFRSPADATEQTSFTYTIEDSNGGRAQATVYVTILGAATPPISPPTSAPAPPLISPKPFPTARADQSSLMEDSPSVGIDVLVNDTSADGDLTNDAIRIIAPPGLGSAQIVGQQIRYQANPDAYGVDTVMYEVCETTNTCDTATVTLTIAARNDPPGFVGPGAIDATEDSGPRTIAGWASGITTGPSNESAQNVGFTVTVDQPAMFATLPAIDANGILTFAPATDANGTTNVTVTAIDDGGTANGGDNTSSLHTTTITITPINDTPSFIHGADINVTEDNGSTTIIGWASSIQTGPPNEGSQHLAFAVQVDNPALFQGAPSVDAVGTLTFTPAANANGSATITVTAIDDGGTTNGGTDSSPPHTATITVAAINDPVVAAADNASVNEDDTGGVTIDALVNDADADADPLTVVSVDTAAISGGTVTDLGLGSFNYTPDSNFNGSDTFTYTVIDGNGSSATASVVITVSPTSDAPVATADAFFTAEDTARVVAAPGLIGNDYDEDGDALAITPVSVAGPSNGTLTLATNGAFTYIPTNGFIGTDSFTYELNDSTGLTATMTVTITVDSGLAGGALYLGNTSALGTWNMTIGAPANATPEPDYDLDGNPGITVADNGALDTKTWIRTISGTPLALNGPITLELWSTIENFDTNRNGHPDVTLYDCNNLGTGCVTLRHTETHINDYNGGVANWVKVNLSLGNITHSFAVGRQLRLQIKQGHHDVWIAASGTRPSRLNYTLANTAPVAVNDTASPVLEDAGPTNIDVLANDADSNLDTTTVAIVTPPAKGTATPQPDGTIDYQPTPDADGADSFTYQVCDTSALCATATVTIAITPVNDQPTFTAGANITINAADPAFSQTGWATGITAGPANETGQTLTFSITAMDPTLFSIQPTLSPTGTLNFSPSGTAGTTIISIQLTDSGGTTNGGNDIAPLQSAVVTFS